MFVYLWYYSFIVIYLGTNPSYIHLFDDLKSGINIPILAVMLDQVVENAGIRNQVVILLCTQKKCLSQIDLIRLNQEIQTSADGFKGGFLMNNWLDCIEHFKNPLMKGRFLKMRHKVEEYTFMEFARFISYLMQNNINCLEFLKLTELMENNNIGGVIMTETPLTRYHVKNVEDLQWIFLTFY